MIATMARRTIMVVGSAIEDLSFASVIGDPTGTTNQTALPITTTLPPSPQRVQRMYPQENGNGHDRTLWLPAHSDRECTRKRTEMDTIADHGTPDNYRRGGHFHRERYHFPVSSVTLVHLFVAGSDKADGSAKAAAERWCCCWGVRGEKRNGVEKGHLFLRPHRGYC